VAGQRALLTEMGVLDDPYARGMLGPSQALVPRRPGLPVDAVSRSGTFLAASR
jgi:hypothetical protein